MPIFSSKKNEFTDTDRNLMRKIEILTASVERVYPSTTKLMFRSFIQGIFFSMGTTVGLSILIGLLTFMFGQLQSIPAVEDILNETNLNKIIPNK